MFRAGGLVCAVKGYPEFRVQGARGLGCVWHLETWVPKVIPAYLGIGLGFGKVHQ